MNIHTDKPISIKDFSVQDNRIYEILMPMPEKEYELFYPYETNEYRIYKAKSGRNYRVYRNGRIYAESFLTPPDKRGIRKKLKYRECKPSKNHGYYELNLGCNYKEKVSLHRLVANVWIDNPHNLPTVNHIDGNKGNNSVENLEYCSIGDNVRKGFEANLYSNARSLHALYRKWKNKHSITDPITRRIIKKDHEENGLKCMELAIKYGITRKQANRIISQKQSEYTDLFLKCYLWEMIIDAINDWKSKQIRREK